MHGHKSFLSFSRKSFSRGRPARASRPRKVPCPSGQGTVCKTVQGGPTPPGASGIFLLHNVTVICIDDSRVRREAGAVLFGFYGIFHHICGVEVRGRGRSAAAATPVPIFTDIRHNTHGLQERQAPRGQRRHSHEKLRQGVSGRGREHRHDIRAAQVHLDVQAEAGRPAGRMSRMCCIWRTFSLYLHGLLFPGPLGYFHGLGRGLCVFPALSFGNPGNFAIFAPDMYMNRACSAITASRKESKDGALQLLRKEI